MVTIAFQRMNLGPASVGTQFVASVIQPKEGRRSAHPGDFNDFCVASAHHEGFYDDGACCKSEHVHSELQKICS